MAIDSLKIKKDFPIFETFSNSNSELIYLDNAATTQKPKQVLDAIVGFYTTSNSNVSRSSHFLADKATDAYEVARKTVARFVGGLPEEIIFTKNATESLNLVALGWDLSEFNNNSQILTTNAEHNSSLLPFKALAQKTGAQISYLSVDESGALPKDWKAQITKDTKIVVVTHVSNVLGVINPISEISKKAHEVGAYVVVDGSQAVPHMKLNVQSLGCDFYVFSGHKMLGPMGIGVLWGKKELLNKLSPVSYGGGTVMDASIDKEDLLPVPERFEAGTPNVAGAVGLAAAIDYLEALDMSVIDHHINDLTLYAYEQLSAIEGLHILGPGKNEKRGGLISFYIGNTHSHDIASVLSNDHIAARSGMHCSMNLYNNLKLPTSTRVSFYIYNDKNDVDILVQSINKAIKLLK